MAQHQACIAANLHPSSAMWLAEIQLVLASWREPLATVEEIHRAAGLSGREAAEWIVNHRDEAGADRETWNAWGAR